MDVADGKGGRGVTRSF